MPVALHVSVQVSGKVTFFVGFSQSKLALLEHGYCAYGGKYTVVQGKWYCRLSTNLETYLQQLGSDIWFEPLQENRQIS